MLHHDETRTTAQAQPPNPAKTTRTSAAIRVSLSSLCTPEPPAAELSLHSWWKYGRIKLLYMASNAQGPVQKNASRAHDYLYCGFELRVCTSSQSRPTLHTSTLHQCQLDRVRVIVQLSLHQLLLRLIVHLSFHQLFSIFLLAASCSESFTFSSSAESSPVHILHLDLHRLLFLDRFDFAARLFGQDVLDYNELIP